MSNKNKNQNQKAVVIEESFDKVSETLNAVEVPNQEEILVNPSLETTEEISSEIEVLTSGDEEEFIKNPSLETTEEDINENPSSNEKFLRIEVNIANVESPISRVEVTQEQIDENPDAYFINGEQAKRYAQNELSAIKDTMPQSEYSEVYWLIETFA
jgi:hypothetical protein